MPHRVILQLITTAELQEKWKKVPVKKSGAG